MDRDFMNTAELTDRIRRGERHAPDPSAVLDAVRRQRQAHRRRRIALQIGMVAAVVVLIAVAATIIATRPAPGPVSPPGPDGTDLSVVPTTTEAAPVTADELTRYRWSVLPEAPIAERDQAAMGWTGTEMIVWGGIGVDAKGDTTSDLADGAAYEPTAKTWRMLPAAPLDARIAQASVWTGTEFIVWGGDHGQTDGAAYNPTTNSWRAVPEVPGPTAVGGTADFPADAAAAWTGEVMQVLTWRYQGTAIQSWYYSPSRDTWTQGDPIRPATNAEIGGAELLVRGDEIDSFVGWSYVDSGGMFDRVTAYARSSGGALWRPIAYRPALELLRPVVGAGAEILLAGGQPFVGLHPSPFMTVSGVRLNPATGTSTPLPAFPAAIDQPTYDITWTGAALLAYNTDEYGQDPDGTTQLPGLAAAWDPGTNAWTTLPSAPLAPYGTTPGVWTGTELLTWGLMFPPNRANDPDRQVRAAGLVFGPTG